MPTGQCDGGISCSLLPDDSIFVLSSQATNWHSDLYFMGGGAFRPWLSNLPLLNYTSTFILDPVYRLPPVQIKVYPFICILDQPACCALDTISSGFHKGCQSFCPYHFHAYTDTLSCFYSFIPHTGLQPHWLCHSPFSSLFFLGFLSYPSPHDLEHMLLLAQSLTRALCLQGLCHS